MPLPQLQRPELPAGQQSASDGGAWAHRARRAQAPLYAHTPRRLPVTLRASSGAYPPPPERWDRLRQTLVQCADAFEGSDLSTPVTVLACVASAARVHGTRLRDRQRAHVRPQRPNRKLSTPSAGCVDSAALAPQLISCLPARASPSSPSPSPSPSLRRRRPAIRRPPPRAHSTCRRTAQLALRVHKRRVGGGCRCCT